MFGDFQLVHFNGRKKTLIRRNSVRPHSRLLKSIYPSNHFQRTQRSHSHSQSHCTQITKARFTEWSGAYGPYLPHYIAAAFQSWRFKAVQFFKYKNDGLYKLLHVGKRQSIRRCRSHRLDANVETETTS